MRGDALGHLRTASSYLCPQVLEKHTQVDLALADFLLHLGNTLGRGQEACRARAHLTLAVRNLIVLLHLREKGVEHCCEPCKLDTPRR